MKKKIALALSIGFAGLFLLPGAAVSCYGSPGPDSGNQSWPGDSRGFAAGSAEGGGGLGRLSLSHIFMPFVVDPPFMLEPPFSRPSYAPRYNNWPVYSYPPSVPPGLCRWERTVLDDSGWPLLDGHGMPVKEYTIGPCTAPPH